MDARIFGITSLVFLTAWMSPAKLQRVDFRSLKASEVIVTDKASPAVAALEDSREIFLDEARSITVTKPEKLRLVSIHDKKIEEPVLPTHEVRKLQVAIISQDPRVDHLAKLIASTLEDPPAPTVSELAEVLVREELARRDRTTRSTDNIRELATAAGQSIIIAKPVIINAGRFVKKPSPPLSSPISQRESPVNPRRVIEQPKSAPKKDNIIASNDNYKATSGKDNFGILSAGLVPSKPKRYVISGPINFSGGAAFLGNRNSITAHQIIDGLSVATGIINIREASYEIAVDDLDGEILGELRNQDGQIMGQGRIDLRTISERNGQEARLKNLALEVRPVFNGTNGTTISAASYGKNKYIVSDAKVYVAGLSREVAKNKKLNTFEDETLSMPSTYLLRGVHDKFWPTLSFAESGEQFELRLFPVGLIEALLNLTLTKYQAREAKNQAVIWGRVSLFGRPIEGAKVHIVGDSLNLPNYFTGFIPDKSKTSTTSRGEFAFTRIKEKEILLRTSLNDKLFLPTLLPTESRHVTYADLELEADRNIELKSYDAFSEAPLETTIQPVGTKENFYIPENGVSRVQLNVVKGMTLFESDAGEPYVVSRAMLKTGQSEVHFPQVKKEWLDNLRSQSSIPKTDVNETATISFVNGDSYDVLIGDGGGENNHVIIYFDSNGEVVKSRHGVAGGGFAVFGLAHGINTVTIIPDRSKKVVTQALYVDEYATSLSRVNLMF